MPHSHPKSQIPGHQIKCGTRMQKPLNTATFLLEPEMILRFDVSLDSGLHFWYKFDLRDIWGTSLGLSITPGIWVFLSELWCSSIREELKQLCGTRVRALALQPDHHTATLALGIITAHWVLAGKWTSILTGLSKLRAYSHCPEVPTLFTLF